MGSGRDGVVFSAMLSAWGAKKKRRAFFSGLPVQALRRLHWLEQIVSVQLARWCMHPCVT
jgi:hypothetical protein